VANKFDSLDTWTHLAWFFGYFHTSRSWKSTRKWLVIRSFVPANRLLVFFGALTWLTWSLLFALFAAATAILAKLGVEGIDANLATAVRISCAL